MSDKTKLFQDIYNNIVPERVPIANFLTLPVVAEYAGISLLEAEYNFEMLLPHMYELAKEIPFDLIPVNPADRWGNRLPAFYQLLGSKSYQMSATGFVQHPEVTGMNEDEYPQLINDPLAFMLETVIPRHFESISYTDPVKMWQSLHMANAAAAQDENALLPGFFEIMETGDYYPGAPLGGFYITVAPYDCIADQLRGFSNISKDIRRHKTEIKEACEAIMPLQFHRGLPEIITPESSVYFPLHMPPYMREKDFEEVYLPSFLKMVQQYAALGVRSYIFCEQDWMRYLDYLKDFPAGTLFMFEFGDPELVAKKLGDKFLISGMYPISLLKSGTKEQCIDKAKELLDAVLPYGSYIFQNDKEPLTLKDFNIENYKAVHEFVMDYGKYPNAGQALGKPFNTEGYVYDEGLMKLRPSKYSFDWTAMKNSIPHLPDAAKQKFESTEIDFIRFVLNLLS